jgi:hypothetical protein
MTNEARALIVVVGGVLSTCVKKRVTLWTMARNSLNGRANPKLAVCEISKQSGQTVDIRWVNHRNFLLVGELSNPDLSTAQGG